MIVLSIYSTILLSACVVLAGQKEEMKASSRVIAGIMFAVGMLFAALYTVDSFMVLSRLTNVIKGLGVYAGLLALTCTFCTYAMQKRWAAKLVSTALFLPVLILGIQSLF